MALQAALARSRVAVSSSRCSGEGWSLSWATSFIASIITHPFYLVQHQKVKGNGGNAIPLPPNDGSLLAQLPMIPRSNPELGVNFSPGNSRADHTTRSDKWVTTIMA